MQIFVYTCLIIYCGFYLFEAPVRYGFNLIGADMLIFARDVILAIPLLFIVFIRQFIQRNLHPAFYIFAAIIIIHGTISLFNIGSPIVLFYSTKILINVLAGAVFAQYFMKIPRGIVIGILIVWLITFLGVLIDKYDIIAYPWTGMETTIGDIKVDITKNWTVTGFDKRAGGLMRSSINVAIITPILAFILWFNLRLLPLRLLIMLMTGFVLYWTTQKTSILAFAATCTLLLAAYKRPIPALKIGISASFLLMIVLPILLPEFTMPNDKGTFSMESLYLRVEDMWPEAWDWIAKHEAFPFGVGLGGIGGAMRLYAPDSVNYADNMFVFLYAYFGIFALLYIFLLWWGCMRVENKNSPESAQAMAIIFFISFYGIALSMIEDQMVALFLGAAAGWFIGKEDKRKVKNYDN